MVIVETKAKTQSKHIHMFTSSYIFIKNNFKLLDNNNLQVCLADIASWTHSFPFRTGQ